MATPQQLLQQAKGTISAPKRSAVRGPNQANMQGTRGAPGRGGAAARPGFGNVMRADGGTAQNGWTPQTGGQSPGSPGGAKLPPLQTLQAAGRDSMQADQVRTFPGFKPRMPADPVLGADLISKLGGREPGGPGAPTLQGFPAPGAPKPAWQQLREMGATGTGTAAGNRAKLAEMQAGGAMAKPFPGGSGPIMAPGAAPGGADAPVSGPAGMGPAGPGGPPPPGADIGGPADFGPPGMSSAGLPGFKPRMPLGGGSLSAVQLPGMLPDAVAQAARGLDRGQVMDTAGPGGDVFGDIARVGAGVGPRPPRQLPANFGARLE